VGDVELSRVDEPLWELALALADGHSCWGVSGSVLLLVLDTRVLYNVYTGGKEDKNTIGQVDI
jgi:hypothetical protein